MSVAIANAQDAVVLPIGPREEGSLQALERIKQLAQNALKTLVNFSEQERQVLYELSEKNAHVFSLQVLFPTNTRKKISISRNKLLHFQHAHITQILKARDSEINKVLAQKMLLNRDLMNLVIDALRQVELDESEIQCFIREAIRLMTLEEKINWIKRLSGRSGAQNRRIFSIVYLELWRYFGRKNASLCSFLEKALKHFIHCEQICLSEAIKLLIHHGHGDSLFKRWSNLPDRGIAETLCKELLAKRFKPYFSIYKAMLKEKEVVDIFLSLNLTEHVLNARLKDLKELLTEGRPYPYQLELLKASFSRLSRKEGIALAPSLSSDLQFVIFEEYMPLSNAEFESYCKEASLEELQAISDHFNSSALFEDPDAMEALFFDYALEDALKPNGNFSRLLELTEDFPNYEACLLKIKAKLLEVSGEHFLKIFLQLDDTDAFIFDLKACLKDHEQKTIAEKIRCFITKEYQESYWNLYESVLDDNGQISIFLNQEISSLGTILSNLLPPSLLTKTLEKIKLERSECFSAIFAAVLKQAAKFDRNIVLDLIQNFASSLTKSDFSSLIGLRSQLPVYELRYLLEQLDFETRSQLIIQSMNDQNIKDEKELVERSVSIHQICEAFEGSKIKKEQLFYHLTFLGDAAILGYYNLAPEIRKHAEVFIGSFLRVNRSLIEHFDKAGKDQLERRPFPLTTGDCIKRQLSKEQVKVVINQTGSKQSLRAFIRQIKPKTVQNQSGRCAQLILCALEERFISPIQLFQDLKNLMQDKTLNWGLFSLIYAGLESGDSDLKEAFLHCYLQALRIDLYPERFLNLSPKQQKFLWEKKPPQELLNYLENEENFPPEDRKSRSLELDLASRWKRTMLNLAQTKSGAYQVIDICQKMLEKNSHSFLTMELISQSSELAPNAFPGLLNLILPYLKDENFLTELLYSFRYRALIDLFPLLLSINKEGFFAELEHAVKSYEVPDLSLEMDRGQFQEKENIRAKARRERFALWLMAMPLDETKELLKEKLQPPLFFNLIASSISNDSRYCHHLSYQKGLEALKYKSVLLSISEIDLSNFIYPLFPAYQNQCSEACGKYLKLHKLDKFEISTDPQKTLFTILACYEKLERLKEIEKEALFKLTVPSLRLMAHHFIEFFQEETLKQLMRNPKYQALLTELYPRLSDSQREALQLALKEALKDLEEDSWFTKKLPCDKTPSILTEWIEKGKTVESETRQYLKLSREPVEAPALAERFKALFLKTQKQIQRLCKLQRELSEKKEQERIKLSDRELHHPNYVKNCNFLYTLLSEKQLLNHPKLDADELIALILKGQSLANLSTLTEFKALVKKQAEIHSESKEEQATLLIALAKDL